MIRAGPRLRLILLRLSKPLTRPVAATVLLTYLKYFRWDRSFCRGVSGPTKAVTNLRGSCKKLCPANKNPSGNRLSNFARNRLYIKRHLTGNNSLESGTIICSGNRIKSTILNITCDQIIKTERRS